MSMSLCSQTGLPYLTIQVLNTIVFFIDIWYTSLTSVHNIYEHVYLIWILIWKFWIELCPLNLNYTTSFVKVQIRSDTPSHAIPDAVYLPCALNWAKLVWTGHSHPKQMLIFFRCQCNALAWGGKSYCCCLPLKVVKFKYAANESS